MKEKFVEALRKLKESSEKRNFVQSVDMIINLSDIDLRKSPLSVLLSFPYKVKEPKICAFLEKKSPAVDRSITKAELTAINANQIKELSKEYDFFLASAPLMGQVATVFGKVLGPLGKMPNPKTGAVLMVEDENSIKVAVKKFKDSVNIKVKEPSIKISIGKEDMPDEEVAENAIAVYNSILSILPNRKENIKSVMLKLTMSKPEKLGVL